MVKKLFAFNKSLLSKLLSSYLLLIIVPTILIGFLSFEASRNIVNDQISRSNINTLSQINKNMTNLLDQIVAQVNLYNINKDIEKSLKTEYTDPINEQMRINEVENKIISYSYAFNLMKQYTTIIGKNGIVYVNPNGGSLLIYDNISQYSWYNELLNDPGKIKWLNTQKGFSQGNNDKYMFTAAKILQGTNPNGYLALLLISIEEVSLYNIYKDVLDNNNGIFIMDSDQNIISHSIREKVGTKNDSKIYSDLISDRQNDYKIATINNQKYLLLYKKIDMLDWYIIESIPMSAINRTADSLKFGIILICVVCVIFSFLAAVFISMKISIPLVKLSKRIKNYNSVNSPDNQQKIFSNEIEILSVGYENIVSLLNKAINDLIKEQENKRKAELKVLQMQINPHFLYNTLNSVKCLVWVNKINLIEPMINALVSLLEQTINRDNELITIDEELSNTKNYLYIQEIRTSNLINTSYTIEEGLLNYKIPRLVLQPIVENAIFHGIESKGNGRILIYCMSYEGNVKIEVMDNGVGMDKNTIDNLFSDSVVHSKNRLSGIGIKNVNERLKLYFGPQYGVKIESELGVGTSVTITLPKIM